eukprot:scaffold6450_cov415-Prasinococcus_capsulatus_cf.AAC.13
MMTSRQDLGAALARWRDGWTRFVPARERAVDPPLLPRCLRASGRLARTAPRPVGGGARAGGSSCCR